MLYALPRMARSAMSPVLMDGFDAQLEETKDHLERLLDISDHLGLRCHTKGGKAMEPMIEAAWRHISDASDELMRDAHLVRAAQSVAHYEIAAYQAAWASASSMGLNSIAALLQKTLREERTTGLRLRALAQKMIQPKRTARRSGLLKLPANTRRMLPQKPLAASLYSSAFYAVA